MNAAEHLMPVTALTLTPPDAEWMREAVCAGAWELMESTEEKDERSVRDLCASCPVWELCRAWTLSLPPSADVYGVAGGMTAKERERARRRVRRSGPRPVRSDEPPKQCSSCGETKPADHFYLHSRGTGARDSRCRPCCTEQTRRSRAAKRAREVSR